MEDGVHNAELNGTTSGFFSAGLGRGFAVHLKGFSKKCRHVLCEICGWGRRAFEDEDKIL